MRDSLILTGTDAIGDLAEEMSKHRVNKAFIVTTAGSTKRGYTQLLNTALSRYGIDLTVFEGITPDPKFSDIENVHRKYRKTGGDCIVSLGGGSTIEAAKTLSIALTNKKPAVKLVGFNDVQTPFKYNST